MDITAIKTARRVFEVLELFREVRRPLSVREISEQLGYPLSSTAVLMRSIASLGYLSYEQRVRAYLPTVRLALLGDWVYELTSRDGSLKSLLYDLAERTDETVVLAVQNDIFSQYLEVIQSSHPLQLYLPPGTRRLMCESGTGWAMLASQPNETLFRMIHRTNLRLGRKEMKFDYEQLKSRITKIRELGYAFSRGAVTPGAGLIAMALPTEKSPTHLAIGVAGLLDRLSAQEERIVKTLRLVLRKHGMSLATEEPAALRLTRR